jgi:lipopolysaccharide transport system ATP-binding protein
MSNTVIKAENIGKSCLAGHQIKTRENYVALRDVIVNKAKGLWAGISNSHEVKQGETVGIIGRNGAGKSTLLKILSRITEPTTGKISIRRRNQQKRRYRLSSFHGGDIGDEV